MSQKALNLGVHCSISGGVHHAFSEAESLNIDVFQIFTKNQRQWKEKVFTESEIDRYEEAIKTYPVSQAFSHASYLINLCGKKEKERERAIKALVEEVNRCETLGLTGTVLHPGFAGNIPIETAIDYIAEGISTVFEETAESKVKIFIENMAGQGTAIGGNFSHLNSIRKLVNHPRLGSCFDTCHAFAAGYDLRKEKGAEEVMDIWKNESGFKKPDIIHLNDSIGKLGSNLDRHQHIGKGEIGIESFAFFMQAYRTIPKIIETPKIENMDRINLNRLIKVA